MIAHQATCVALAGRGVMIEGAPGSGKSSLALGLIDRGAVLVGDDSLLVAALDGRLVAHPHPETRGLLEVRNLGLIAMSVCDAAPVSLLIRLDREAPRFIEQAATVERLGCALPAIALWPDIALNPIKAELALLRFGIA